MTTQPGALSATVAASPAVSITAPVFVPGAAHQIGIAALLQAAYMGVDLKPLGTELIAHLGANPDDANAMMDLSIILQLLATMIQRLSRRPKRSGCSSCITCRRRAETTLNCVYWQS
jgi:hypothetical protein